METDIEKKLKKAIAEELGNCNPKLWAEICELRTTEEGYAKIERMVVHYVATEGMPIGSALALIEQELEHIKK